MLQATVTPLFESMKIESDAIETKQLNLLELLAKIQCGFFMRIEVN